ncbi:hypothetical protein IU469_29990 [Nocardia puris]|uniref:DUF8175 domain-containing protein n=1 Tax=Nocardia puris TaxID=208602 RepID=A0A366D7S2_9NOCA|nr:hypothetical protein [Nocardia puris]MBF6369911.1 hypothetical protein [Nocardia puris]RBO85328.1 hypothetical protein DFR74_115176 [Nocardia puris]
MKLSRAQRIPRASRIAVLAFTGPIAAAALLGCASDPEPSTAGPSSTTWATDRPPSGVHWRPYQGVELPITDQGPHRVEGAVASEFDRNPAGAAVAAIHANVRIAVADDRDWATVGQQMLAEGPGRDSWAVLRAQVSITEPATGAPRILGYRIARYTLDVAEVDIYSRHPDESVTVHRAQVVWRADGWRLLLPEIPGYHTVTTAAAAPPDMVVLPWP